MNDKCKKEALELLQSKASEIGRLPKKADFQEDTARFIRRMLGPWPRALEQAGLKEISPTYMGKKARNRVKRKRRRNQNKA